MSNRIKHLNRILLAGTGSGCGKTTITCGLLNALVRRGVEVKSFKCGPDYIDPMFHSEIIGTKSRNLDLFLCGENTVKYLLAEDADLREEKGGCPEKAAYAVIEGVMGLYDGIGFEDDRFSANHIARVTQTPEILVVTVRGKGRSLLAEISGYLSFSENRVEAVILNHCSSGMYPVYRNMIEENLPVKVLGFLPPIPQAAIESRHLGLVTAQEIQDLKDKVDALGKAAEEYLDIDGILALAETAPEISYEGIPLTAAVKTSPRIAVAKDKAFCFYYEDNFRLLKRLGAQLVFFSPLKDESLPDNISGLYFGGGYPEEYLKPLSENRRMLRQVKEAVQSGMPVFAECGGFMYLGETITRDGKTYPMASAVSGNFHMTEGLVRFGYKTLYANCDNLMCKKGDSIGCHEFHYSDTDCYGQGFTAWKGERSWQTIHADETVFAGYPHLHLWGNVTFAENFVKKCAAYGAAAGMGGTAWKSLS